MESNAEDRIIIRLGTYTDPVTVEKNVCLIGEGPLKDIRLQVTDHTAVTIRTETCHIENISIQQIGIQESFAPDIALESSTIVGCNISSKGLACISLHGTASPVIKANKVRSGTETGIMIAGQSQAIIDSNMVFGNEFAGSEIRDEANPQINNNHIYGETRE